VVAAFEEESTNGDQLKGKSKGNLSGIPSFRSARRRLWLWRQSKPLNRQCIVSKTNSLRTLAVTPFLVIPSTAKSTGISSPTTRILCSAFGLQSEAWTLFLGDVVS
jgi:hypothetical protein